MASPSKRLAVGHGSVVDNFIVEPEWTKLMASSILNVSDFGGGKMSPVPEHTHRVENLGFSEDRMVGVCEECAQVVHVMVFPGSLNTIRARILLETYAANKLASRYDDEVISLSDVIDEIHMLRRLLDMDVQELELAQDRLKLVEGDLVANL